MNISDPRKSRWIVLNSGTRIDIPIDNPRFILYPYNTKFGISYTDNRLMLQVVRPSCNMTKKFGRYCKDKVYQIMAAHCAIANVNGSYIGLAANYPGEIFVNFSPWLNGKFYTYELNTISYQNLIKYQGLVASAFPKYKFKVDFEVRHGDIIKEMSSLGRIASVIDLDLMEGVGKRKGHEAWQIHRGRLSKLLNLIS